MADVSIKYRGSEIANMSATGSKTLGTQGKYCDSDVVVAYTKPAGAVIESNKNATPSESQQEITPSSGYDAMAKVTVAAVSSSYVGTAVPRRSSDDLTASGATVTVPAGFYASQASKSVATGTAGTPTATKGTVSNHSVSVTPAVTNTTGYISGSTKTGTPATVTASELVSGSETKTANGTYDVTNLAQLIVNVAGGGGSGIEYETGTYTPDADIARPTITFSKTHSEAPVLVFFADVTGTAHSATNSNYLFFFCDPYKLWGNGFPYASNGYRYAVAYYGYRTSSTSQITYSASICSQNSDSTLSSGSMYPRYWATATDFHPYSSSSSRYWRAGRTYKWIAVWKP